MAVEEATHRIERGEPKESMPGTLLVARRRQESRVPRAVHHYSWLEDYLERIDGKEARDDYYARFEY